MKKNDAYSLGVPIRPLRCPHCKGTNLSVTDSRGIHNTTRRRRKCEDCKERFSTSEFYMKSGAHQGVDLLLCQAMGLPKLTTEDLEAVRSLKEELGAILDKYL